MKQSTATTIGFVAVLTWALLALFTAGAGPVPPFQLAAMAFGVGGLVGAITWPFRPAARASLRQTWQVWTVGCVGLSLYHVLYFFALQNAPAVEASLIAYLWPLLIVVFATMLPGETLRAGHILGVLLGLCGAVLVITRGFSTGLSDGVRPGHLYAIACALIWSGYSVLSRRFGTVPTDVVAGYCLVSSFVCGFLHIILETTVWPATSLAWASVLGLGLLPMGLAFYVWDWGCKHGNIMVLAALSYAAPVLSTIVLLIFGISDWHWSVAAACALITLGAVVASRSKPL